MLDFTLEMEEDDKKAYKSLLVDYKVTKRFKDCTFIKMFYKVVKGDYTKGYQIRSLVIDEHGNKLLSNLRNYTYLHSKQAFDDYGKE